MNIRSPYTPYTPYSIYFRETLAVESVLIEFGGVVNLLAMAHVPPSAVRDGMLHASCEWRQEGPMSEHVGLDAFPVHTVS